MNRNIADAEHFEQGAWDALVVGTGMGGATLGLALARAGWRVLFVEKGRNHLASTEALRGNFAEAFLPAERKARDAERPTTYARAGRQWESIEDRSGKKACSFVPFIGSGSGGSSALYGMALERLRPADFFSWPVSHDAMRPYYEQTERLFGVCGGRDPLNPDGDFNALLAPPPLHPANQTLKAFFDARGLHPYRLPVACDYSRGSDRCQGFLDATGARNDAENTCLRPALENFGAELIDRCNVVRIEATRDRVGAVHCLRDGRALTLRANVVVLAGGALATPCLLLRSVSRAWPRGLANASGLVGRNLMRHFIDLYFVRARGGDVRTGNVKELAFNDWYSSQGGGTVQSFGALPAPEILLAEMFDELRQSRMAPLVPLLRLSTPLLRRVLQRKAATNLVLASILEDSPCEENRVMPGATADAPAAFEYRICPTDAARIAAFRAKMKRLLAPLGVTLVKQAENNRRLAHVCGTCRFGDDPRSSVLDPDCRAHGLENLYVADASFFPTSGGTNPGLTIAANALRMADRLIAGSRIEKRPMAAVLSA